jgi:hypothetical protein
LGISGLSLSGGVIALKVLYPLVAPMLRSIATQFATSLARIIELDAGTSAAEAAAEIELADLEATSAVGEEAAVEVGAAIAGISAGALCLIGIGIVVAIVFFALFFVLHVSYHRVKLWNVTQYRALWKPWFDEGGLVWAPVKLDANKNIESYVPFEHVCGGAPVPGTKAEPQAHYYDLSVNSESEWHGIGYTMQMQLVDPDNESDVKYTCTLMFDIPWMGKNSTSVTFDNVDDVEQWYHSQEGQNNSTKVVASSSDSKIKATVTYDYLEGKHVVPGQEGQGSNEAYYYQSIILLEQDGLKASTLPTCPTKKS